MEAWDAHNTHGGSGHLGSSGSSLSRYLRKTSGEEMITLLDTVLDKYDIRLSGVLHLGANTGQEAELYQRRGAKMVIWVEAIPAVYEKLVKRVERFPGHVPLLACLGDEDGKRVKFNVANNEGQSSSLFEFGTHQIEHPSVKFIDQIEMETVRPDTLLHRSHLAIGQNWFLHLDLQGAELLALKGMGELLWRFAWVYSEVNQKELYVGCPHVREIDNYLACFDFVGIETKMERHFWGDKLYGRRDEK